MPSSYLIFVGLTVVVLFILGGNLYTLINAPPSIIVGPNGDTPTLFSPTPDTQLALEGIAASVTIFMGALGLAIIYYSSRFVFEPSLATRLMLIGMIMATAGFLVLNYMFALKLTA